MARPHQFAPISLPFASPASCVNTSLVYQQRRIGLAIDPVGSYGRGVIRGIMNFCRSEPSWVIAIEPRWSFGRLPPVDEWDVDGVIVQTSSHEFEEEVLRRGVPATNVTHLNSEET